MPRAIARLLAWFPAPLLGSVLAAAAMAAAPPGEVGNIRVQRVFGVAGSVSWDADPDAFYYQVYVGTLSTLPNYCSVHRSPLTGLDFLDTTVLASGDASVYLVTAIGVGGEGTLGSISSGSLRSATVDCDSDLDGVFDSQDNCPDDANPGQTDSDSDNQGDACEFESLGVDLAGRVPMNRFPRDPGFSWQANDVWHYVSPLGQEYAILGLRNGTAFIRVTDPADPELVGYIDGGPVNQPWRDMAFYDEHAYIVSDGAGVGLQIADLTDIDNDLVTLVNTTDLGMGFTNAHNVHVNLDSGFLYLVIPDLNSGLGITAVDLNIDPADPFVVGFWTDTDRSVRCHDLQVVSYTSGPNAGKEIAFCFAENDGIRIVDVTNKAAMFRLSKLVYPTTDYTHQGWLTEDRKFLLVGDEGDELHDPNVTSTTTYVVDVSDLAAPQLTTTFSNGLASIDHNLMVTGDFAFEANYSSGLRIFSICDVDNIHETGFFDSYPADDAASFNGAWGVSSALPSGTVIVSDRSAGLLVLDVADAVAHTVDKCSTGPALLESCDICVEQICDDRPDCCSSAWDDACILHVRTTCDSLLCEESAGSCSHTLCSEGAALLSGCDAPPLNPSCVDAICGLHPSCCMSAWDETCVAAVMGICGMNCN